jgi:hypothetical protein
MVRDGTRRGANWKVKKPAEILAPVAGFEELVPIVAGNFLSC